MKYLIKPEYSLDWMPVGSAKELQLFLNYTEYKCEVKVDD